MATDKERIIKKLTHGGEKPASHYVPDGTATTNPPAGLPFAPEQARALLAQAGFPGGKGFPQIQYSYYSAASGGARHWQNCRPNCNKCGATNWHRCPASPIERKSFLSANPDSISTSPPRVDRRLQHATRFRHVLSNSGNNRTGWKNVPL